jgi:hypothetical protein
MSREAVDRKLVLHRQAELRAIGDLIEAYEAQRQPFGKEPSAKGQETETASTRLLTL